MALRVLIGCEFSGVVRDAFLARGHDAWSCDLLPAERGHEFHICGDVRDVLGNGWDLGIFHPDCTYLTNSAEWAYKDPDFDRYPGVGYHQKLQADTLFGQKRRSARAEAVEFFRLLLNAPIKRIAIENPVGVISQVIRKPDQTIHPWQFGHDASKATCLWIKGLRKLQPTRIVPPGGYQEVVYAMSLPICDCCGEEAYCPTHETHFADCSCIGPTQDGATYRTIGGCQFATLIDPAPQPVWGNQTSSGQNNLPPSADRWKLRAKTYEGIAAAMADQWGTGPKTGA